MKAKLITLLFLLVVSLSFYGQEPAQKEEQIVQPKADSITTKRNEPLKVFLVDGNGKMVEETTSWKDWVGIIISIITLIVSFTSLVQVGLTKAALHQNVKNRNLNYLSELDRFLIEKPILWQFYDTYYHQAMSNGEEIVDENELRGFIYYKLNHFEITLLEKNMGDMTRMGWDNYMIYCMNHSSKFREEVESILLDKGYKGLFDHRFILKLAELYKEASHKNSDFNTRLEQDFKIVKKEREKISGFIPASIINPTYKIKLNSIEKIINYYREKSDCD